MLHEQAASDVGVNMAAECFHACRCLHLRNVCGSAFSDACSGSHPFDAHPVQDSGAVLVFFRGNLLQGRMPKGLFDKWHL